MKFITTCWIALLLLTPVASYAAKVLQVKNNKVLIDLEGATISNGDEFFLISPTSQKKTAIIRVRQIKNGRAVAEILKGKGAAGSTLQAKASSSRPMSAEVRDETSPASSLHGYSYQKFLKNSWGVLGEYLMTTMSASFSRTTPTSHVASTSMKGSGLGVGGFYNYVFAPNFSGAVEASFQQFNATGSTAVNTDCNNSADCNVKITYLSFYGMGRYYFSTGKLRAWAGLGGGYLLAASKSSTVLNASQISSNQVFSFGLGGDYQLSRKNYIPFSMQYDLFPSSPSVKANMLSLRVGYGWNL